MTIKNHMKNWNFLYKGNEKAEQLAKAFCVNHSAKMSGIISISTSVLMNKRCNARRKCKANICYYCFAVALANARANLAKKLMRNYYLLTSELLTEEDIPIINYEKWPLLRFESFGDLNNEIQVYNYFLIAKVNHNCKCALWSKNPDIIKSAMEMYGIEKPDNMTILYSSIRVNECESDILNKYGFVDKVFTVFDTETAKTVNINCGARDCRKCARCYARDTESLVNEILK